MKKLLSLVLGLSLLFFGSAYATGIKVGVIDMAQIMQHSTQISAINKQLQSQFEPQQKKIMEAQTALRNDAAKLTSGNQLSDKERQAIQDKVAQGQKDLQAMVVKFQQSVSDAQAKSMKDFMDQINVAAKTVATKQNLDIVLLKQAVVYAGDTIDITAQVMDTLPKK